METEEIKVGKYTFLIKDNILSYDNRIISRNFSIRGSDTIYVIVSISYKNNEPIYASIPYLLHDPECSIDFPLDKGKETIIMIKTLLKYIQEKIPSIKEFHFEDKSAIESASQEEIEIKKSKNMKKGTNIIPIPLYYLSIAFNGITWYEKYFNAKMKDPNKHKLYREKVNTLLYNEEIKKNTSFIEFLEYSISSPFKHENDLKPYYNKSNTFGDFFQSIPPPDRIRLVRDWIEKFMLYHLENVFSNKNWIIEVPIKSYIEESIIQENTSNEKKGGKKSKRRTKKYYCPNGRILLNPVIKGLILGPEDI